jgi:hypothetical protein
MPKMEVSKEYAEAVRARARADDLYFVMLEAFRARRISRRSYKEAIEAHNESRRVFSAAFAKEPGIGKYFS